MKSYNYYRIDLDRESNLFDFFIDYTIEGYSDPETGEYFGNTSWSVQFTGTGITPGGIGGFAAESETVWLSLGLAPVSAAYLVSFSAFNTFSGVSIAESWNVVAEAYSTTPQTMTGTTTADFMVAGAGADLISSLGGSDFIEAGEGDDTIDAGPGADEIDGAAGADTMTGGEGDDYYHVDDAADAVVEQAAQGTDTIRTTISLTLPLHVERLILDHAGGAIDGIGGGAGEILTGNGAANTLRGNGGGDELFGGGDKDRLFGGNGADLLDGGDGGDLMDGGFGDDIYRVDSVHDRPMEAKNAGTDTLRVTGLAAYTIGANIEHLETLGTGPFRGVGNALANTITGSAAHDTLAGRDGNDHLVGRSGNDRLIGGFGGDTLDGGEGIDTASYADAPAGVTLSLAGGGTGGIALGDSFVAVENVEGSDHADTLTGDGGANRLLGRGGADTIDGAGGDDIIIGGAGGETLIGGTGIDSVSYAGSALPVTINLAAGTAAGGDAQDDSIAGFENVGGGDGDDHITGDAGSNTLVGGLGGDTLLGGDGRDVLLGGAGADTMHGGRDTDTVSYAGAVAGVVVNLATQTASGGDAAGDTISGFEYAAGGTGADTLTGSAGANTLIGNAGDDTLDGGEGDDRIWGGAGADAMQGGGGIDTLSYSGSRNGGVVVDLQTLVAFAGDAAGDSFAGFENVEGSALGDGLSGDGGANRLVGGGGFDLLDGRGGADVLSGGADSDSFVFAAGYGHDIITDFIPGLVGDGIAFNLGEAFDSFAEVMAVAAPHGLGGADLVFTFDAVTSLTLRNVSAGALVEDNFHF